MKRLFFILIASSFLFACSEEKKQDAKPVESKPIVKTDSSVNVNQNTVQQSVEQDNAETVLNNPDKIRAIARMEAKKYCDYMDKLIENSKNDRDKVNTGIADYNLKLSDRLKSMTTNPVFQQAFDDAMEKMAPEVEKKHPEYFKKLKR